MDAVGILIAVLDAMGGVVEGRTTIQKVVYFASVKTKVEMGYRPHYYGPYSETVASLLENFVALDFIMEKGRYTTHDRFMYGYFLTDDGKTLAKQIRKRDSSGYNIVKEVVDKCKRITHNNIHILSWAAKVHFLLAQKGEVISYEEAIEAGKSFGWKLSEREIDSAIKLLSVLQLAKKTTD